MTQAGFALPMPCLAPAMLCPLPLSYLSLHSLSFFLNEKSLFIVSMERRDSPCKARHGAGKVCLARHDTGRVRLGLALALPLPLPFLVPLLLPK